MGRIFDEAEQLRFATAAEWRAWLARNHTRQQGVWLVQSRQGASRQAVAYEDAVCEALCFGWIDSTYRRIDDEHGALWWSPRRKGSLWASSNKERVVRLEAEGRMTDAGRAAIEQAKADGSWSLLEPVEALVVPDDLAAALGARAGARDRWEAFAPTIRRAYLLWVATAKRAQTRARRVAETADLVAAGKRLDQR